ncbi:NAD(P)H-dependent oxidoreductase [Candidatus Peregrinibacteria bacterium HGW-Peregrinibacteria-1]|jgi:nitroreductase|nr:MAG: NAD(P)H-dependent oxidoreductase [Candidatus Peregrinibacteria bacterium HGW-Peregrinibacteria-1]
MQEAILKALNWRYAVNVFDTSKKVSDEDLKVILEAGRLAPSSFGVEAWKFLVINNPEVRAQLKEVSFGQAKVTDASHLVVLAYRTDVAENISRELVERVSSVRGVALDDLSGLKNMVDGAIGMKAADGMVDAWAKAQTYIALGVMMETAALLGVDAGPMEGFLPDKVDEVLGLKDKNLSSVTMLALGYRGDDPMADAKKVRRSFDEVVEMI